MRIQTGRLIALGYGKFVRSDEVVAIEPIAENRGPGRRTSVWVRGIPDPFRRLARRAVARRRPNRSRRRVRSVLTHSRVRAAVY